MLAPFGEGSNLSDENEPATTSTATTTTSSPPTTTTKGKAKRTRPARTQASAGRVTTADYRVQRVRWAQYSDARKLAAATLFVKNNPQSCAGRAPASIVNFLHERWERDYPRAIATDVMLAYCERSDERRQRRLTRRR